MVIIKESAGLCAFWQGSMHGFELSGSKLDFRCTPSDECVREGRLINPAKGGHR
jgi:hypothetical protein